MKQRIQKVLAGVESRRHLEQMVLDGRISVNGRVERSLPLMVDPLVDRITVDGEAWRPPATTDYAYVLLHKPRGVVCTNVAQGVQRRAIDLLPPALARRVYPVGRLAADARGVLLLTDDGVLTHRLTHPSFGIERTYHARVRGLVTPQTLAQLRQRLAIPRRPGAPAPRRPSVELLNQDEVDSTLEVTLSVGGNDELRLLLEEAGFKLKQLIRMSFGPLNLKSLAPGEYRPLSEREVADLRKLVDLGEGESLLVERPE